MADETGLQSRIKKYAPVAGMLALVGVGVKLTSSYPAEAMLGLGFERRTVTKTVWVSPWWFDALGVAFLVMIIAAVLYAPAVLPRGGFHR